MVAASAAAGDGKLAFGPFELIPRLVITSGYDDNVFVTSDTAREDWYFIVTPSFRLSGRDEAFRFDLSAGVEIGRYLDQSSLNYEDFWIETNGQYKFSPKTTVFGGISYAFEHESRTSPDATFGSEPTTYDVGDAHVGLSQRFGDFALRAGGTARLLDFEDTPSTMGTINEDDRDQERYELGARLTWLWSDDIRPFVQVAGDFRDYRLSLDDDGYERSSAGFRASLGMIWRPDAGVEIEVFAGGLSQDYRDARFADVETFLFGGKIDWQIAKGTSLRASIDRTVEDTTLTGASSYLYTDYGITLNQRLDNDLTAVLHLGYADTDYRDVARRDETFEVSWGLKRYVDPHLYLALDHSFERRTSDDPFGGYDRNLVYLRLGAQWDEGVPQSVFDGKPESDIAALEGFYLGLGAGVLQEHAELFGPRGAPNDDGFLDADFADTGATGKIFAGYAWSLGRWVVGLEASAAAVDAGWSHARLPDGRVFSADTQTALALDLLAGRAFNGSNLVYARLGAGWLDRSALYRTAGDSAAYDEWDVAYRFGAGVETPVGEEIAVRLEAIVASYDDFELAAGDEPDRFAGASVETSMSLVYRPGQGAPGDSAVSHDFAGFYAGAGLGVGTSETRVTGPRQAGSALDADFGGAGVEGAVFAGYGGVWDRFYLGIEASLDAGTTAWRHVREDEGRVFAVDRTYAWSLAARVGYIVPDSALFYLKAGLRSQSLATEYESGAGFFDQEEQLTGLVFGPGIELALTDRAFVRAEYVFSDLGDYTVTYGANTDRFSENEVSLTTIGIGIRL